MSKEMLPEKLSRDQSNDQGLGPESLPIVIETNEGEKITVISSFSLGCWNKNTCIDHDCFTAICELFWR
jgi:hypothetical protein